MKAVLLTLFITLLIQVVVIFYYRKPILEAIKIAANLYEEKDVISFVKSHHYNLQSEFNLKNKLFIFNLKRTKNAKR